MTALLWKLSRLAVVLILPTSSSCAVGLSGTDVFNIEPMWRVEEQTENGDWRVIGTARFEREEHCLAVVDETQRCKERL
jgi:hypothetical protein